MTTIEVLGAPVVVLVAPVPFGATQRPAEPSPGLMALRLAIEHTRYGHIFCVAHAVGVYPA